MASANLPTFKPADWSGNRYDPHDRFLGDLVGETWEGVRTICFGVPFDGATQGRKGARHGPRGLRQAARGLKANRLVAGPPPGGILDLGDVDPLPAAVSEALHVVEQAAEVAMVQAEERSQDAGVAVVAFGGDHAISYACVRPYLRKYGDRLGVINLDAHLDVREVSPEGRINSGTPFGRLLEEGLRHYVVIGAQDFQTSAYYVDRLAAAGGSVVSARLVYQSDLQTLMHEVLRGRLASCEALYLSLDLDVVEAGCAPGVSAPTPGGLLPWQVLAMIRAVAADPRWVAGDIVELAPPLEQGGDLTCRLAATCFAEMVFRGEERSGG